MMTKTKEQQIEDILIEKLQGLGYTYSPDIHDHEALERNFREKFEALNQVRLTEAEITRLRSLATKEKRMARQVELNQELKRLQAQYAIALNNL